MPERFISSYMLKPFPNLWIWYQARRVGFTTNQPSAKQKANKNNVQGSNFPNSSARLEDGRKVEDNSQTGVISLAFSNSRHNLKFETPGPSREQSSSP
jgi:hypothetical protein